MIYIVLDSGIEVFFLYLAILNKGNEDLNTVDSEIEGKTRLRRVYKCVTSVGSFIVSSN